MGFLPCCALCLSSPSLCSGFVLSLFLFLFLRGDDQVFYRMLPDAPAQWILAFPGEAAPRTLEGLFEGEVVEFVQVSVRQREREKRNRERGRLCGFRNGVGESCVIKQANCWVIPSKV